MNLKFRGWNTVKRKFLTTKELLSIINSEANRQFILSNNYISLTGKPDPSDETIFQQFTGMKDSCGVEVYEGDIVQRDNHTAEVFWNDTIGGFDLAWRENKYIHDEHSYVFNFRNLLTMKVIGHINE